MPNVVLLPFLWTVLIGATVFTMAWLPTRLLVRRSRTWRFILSGVAALAIAPSVGNFCGSESVVPAALFLFMSLLEVTADLLARLTLFAQGAIPVAAIAMAVFFPWTYYVERHRA